ncbi:hypothetical protein M3Y99_01945100 [Aphelenchoides fujianensis]|nr:hypothetical protein M3Y99_01945100 [Aphelenchoides fujianensis]
MDAKQPVEFKFKNQTERWEEIAKGDLLDAAFGEYLSVNKGIQAFSELKGSPLTESAYRAQAALLNAALVNQLEGVLHHTATKRFQDLFQRLDLLISQSSTLPKTPTLIEFQRYAKSSLYYRLGDFLLTPAKPNNDGVEKSQFLSAMCAYALALDYLCRGTASHEITSAAEAFNVLELHILLSTNLPHIGGQEALREALLSDKLAQRLTRPLNLLEGGNAAGLSFVHTDAAERARGLEIPKLEVRKLLAHVWPARRHSCFLKRFLWIRARVHVDDDDFLDTLVTRFIRFPRSLALMYSVSDFSLLDLKLMIFRMSAYREQADMHFKIGDRSLAYPPQFQTGGNKEFTKIWAIVNVLADNGDYRRDKGSDQILFVTTLEEIRRAVSYESDKTNLARTAAYLWNKIKRSPPLPLEQRQLLADLFVRYAESVIAESSAAHHRSSVFPPLASSGGEHENEEELNDQIFYLLAQNAVLQSDYATAESHVLNIRDGSQYKDNAQALLSRMRQRSSKNGSPNSLGSFQLVDDVNLQAVEEDGSMDETFLTCNAPAADATADRTAQLLDATGGTLGAPKRADELSANEREGLAQLFDEYIHSIRRQIDELKSVLAMSPKIKQEALFRF